MKCIKSTWLALRYNLDLVSAKEDLAIRLHHVRKTAPAALNVLAASVSAAALGLFFPFCIQPSLWPDSFSYDFFQSWPGAFCCMSSAFFGIWALKQTTPSLRHHVCMVIDPMKESTRATYRSLHELFNMTMNILFASFAIVLPCFFAYRAMRVLI